MVIISGNCTDGVLIILQMICVDCDPGFEVKDGDDGCGNKLFRVKKCKKVFGLRIKMQLVLFY